MMVSAIHGNKEITTLIKQNRINKRVINNDVKN